MFQLQPVCSPTKSYVSEVSVTIQDWHQNAKAKLRQANIPSAELDSQLLLSYALRKDRTWIIAHITDSLSKEITKKANSYLARRLMREPLAYIRGWQEFYGRRFIVTPDTLIPRPESETIIGFLKNLSPSGILLDVGTGCGALGLTASKEFPNLTVILSDISSEALKIAQENYEALHDQSSKTTSFIQSNLLESISVQANIIVANLPYVDKDWQRSPETDFEPSLALFADHKGLKLIFELIKQASQKLTSSGILILEADPRQFVAIKAFANEHNFMLMASEGFILQFQKQTSRDTQST
jgi:release factor glutamine methyltransferase